MGYKNLRHTVANNVWEIRDNRDTLIHTFKNNYDVKFQLLKNFQHRLTSRLDPRSNSI